MTNISEVECERISNYLHAEPYSYPEAGKLIEALRKALTRAEQQLADAEAACQVQIAGADAGSQQPAFCGA